MNAAEPKPLSRQPTFGWGERKHKWWEYILYPIEYAAFRSIMALFWVLGLERASDLGGWIARSIGPKMPVSRRAQRALILAMPDLTADQRADIIRRMWDNLGRTFGEYPHLDKFWAIKPGARIEIENLAIAHEAVAKGHGALFVSGLATGRAVMVLGGHFGNWEIMPRCIKDAGLEGGIVYRATNNPLVDHWITTQRQTHILPNMAPKGPEGARIILQLLKRNAMIAMLVDQKLNTGIEVPLFGHPAMTAPAAAHLSLKYGAPVVPVFNQRLPGSRFRVTIHPPVTVTPSGDRAADVMALTLKLNQFLEARIREAPEMWLWLHNRWSKELTKAIPLAK